jgi:DnaJ homologue, subfamily C, member 28, conserved domain
MPVERRNADGSRQVGSSWESLVERQIREAMEEGAFSHLPFQGQPLPIEDDATTGEWAMAHRILRNAGAAPPWIEADKEVRRLLVRRDELLSRPRRSTTSGRARGRSDLTVLVASINDAIARVNAEAPTIRQHRRPLDLEAELARLDETPDS